ncbi:MAG: type I-E CRISPR-associated protein Cas5/CasD [Proteobacteria bacterium]|nr:type I-E CRISPR-associated protein Cas5/CasD [Pseudomonadota bacterium]
MRSLLLRLEGPLQSWGTQGRFGIRDTDTEPSKSGVLGLLASALGAPRDDDATVARLAELQMAVRVDREGQLLRDYHTVGAGMFRGRRHALYGTTKTAVTHRYYLSDASFLVALGGSDAAFLNRAAGALQDPRWPLFLGRKACVPSMPIFVAVVDALPKEALCSVALQAAAPGPVRERVRLVLESDEGDARNDVPLSFCLYARQHTSRCVRTEWLNVAEVEGGAP